MLLSTPRVTENGPDEQYRQLVQSGYMDGMIALDNVPLASVLAPVDQSRTPVVVIGYRSAEYSVHSDDRGGGEALIRHVLELGHRRIGIITVPSNMNYALNERMNAIRHVIEEAGIDFHSIPVAYGDFSTKGGAAMTELLLWQRPDLTAVVCLTDRMALGAIQKLHEMGYNVPDDITVVGYDNIAMSEVVNPALTTISQEPTAIGAAAARMLFAVLQGHKPTPAVLPIRLIVRESSAVPRE
jgi:DNA-binding LacI/PurR family transcriptional regulator